MKLHFLQICIMILLYQSIEASSSLESPVDQSLTDSTGTIDLTSLRSDIDGLQISLESADINAESLEKLQAAQKSLSEQIEELTGSAQAEQDFRTLQRTITDLQILLINLKRGDLSAQLSLERKMQKLTDTQALFKIDLDAIKGDQESESATLASLSGAEGTIEAANASLSETKDLISELKNAAKSVKTEIATTKATRATIIDLAEVQALANSISLKISDIQKVLERKAERSAVASLTSEAKRKADSASLKSVALSLENAIDDKANKSDFDIFMKHINQQMTRIHTKVDNFIASKESTESADTVTAPIDKVQENVNKVNVSIADQTGKISELQKRMEIIDSTKVTTAELSALEKQLDAEVSTKANEESVADLKSRMNVMQSNQKHTEEDLAGVAKTIDDMDIKLAAFEHSKASTQEVTKLKEEYDLVQRTLKSVEHDVSANGESIAATKALYEALSDSLQDLSNEILALRMLYNSHTAIAEDIRLKEAQDKLTTIGKFLGISKLATSPAINAVVYNVTVRDTATDKTATVPLKQTSATVDSDGTLICTANAEVTFE